MSRLSRRRKAVYALVALALLLGAAEGVSHLLQGEEPPPGPQYPDLPAFMGTALGQVKMAKYKDADGPLPGAKGPAVLMRVPEKEKCSQPYGGPGGFFCLVQPGALPAGQRVLILGASAAYGDGVTHQQTFALRLQQMLEGQGHASVKVLNLARPAWELNSVALLLLRLLRELRPAPAAVVLYAGNNEFLNPPLQAVGSAPWQRLASYRLLKRVFKERGWLRPPPTWNFTYFKEPNWEVTSPGFAQQRIWHPPSGVPDASYWSTVRQAHLSHYRDTIESLVKELRSRKIPLVLVPPPMNLHLFVGGIQPQPATYKEVGGRQYERLTARLEQALASQDREVLRELLRDEPSGPIQQYMEGQWLDQQGRHVEAAAQLMSARDNMMGLLTALPSMAAITRELKGPGVKVVDTRDWYPPGESVRLRSRLLFNDSCHLSPRGHQQMAAKLAPVLQEILSRDRGEVH